MENPGLQRRTDLLGALQAKLSGINLRLVETVAAINSELCLFYEKAFYEKQDELKSETEGHRRNTGRIREINDEITSAINTWYEFVKDTGEMEKPAFPIRYSIRKKALLKAMEKLNAEISDITIKNRFIREKLTILEHQLEIEAMVLAKASDNYREYEKLLQEREALIAELKYLAPTVKGAS